MRVAGQIVEDILRSSEGPFGVDDPALSKERPEEGAKRFLLGQRLQRPGKRVAWRKARFRPATNLPRKTGSELAPAGRTHSVGESSAGDREKDHRLESRSEYADEIESLTPGVEHAQKTDLGPKMLRIGGNFQQRRSAGVEQEVVDESSDSGRPRPTRAES